ncbi:hypothetical protein Prubr_12550 [Polymorphospora rubra]|uniref:Uncharacterized protein n=1 Tax=Polymorphospora rubra TaxID=338584 RepID=A0A810MUH7_9ACTN|nr:hypothetical protein Prubr_12550 [Polymorphospora rubra]
MGGWAAPPGPSYGPPPGPSYGPPTTPMSGPPMGDYPPQQPTYAQPVPPYGQPPKRSNNGLLIGMGVAVLVLLLAVGGLGIALLAGGDDEPEVTTQPTTSTTEEPGGTEPSGEPSPDSPPPANNNAVTAKYSSDFEEVCAGGAILNAADYTAGSNTTKVYAFSNSPDRASDWRTRSVGYDKPFYAKSADFTTVSVVACLTTVPGSEGTPKKCDYKDRDEKPIQVDYISSRLDVAFYAAKTGQKLGTGDQVNAPANRCPSYISYNSSTMKAYAAPDEGAITAAIEKFLS